MLPARLAPAIFALTLSMIMSAIISGASTISAMGLVPELPGVWVRAWLTSWAIAFPSVMLVAPFARRVVARITAPPRPDPAHRDRAP